jgi:hypothetical protein
MRGFRGCWAFLQNPAVGLSSLVHLCELQLTGVCLGSVTGTRHRDSDADESPAQLRYFHVPSNDGRAGSSNGGGNNSSSSSDVAGVPGGPARDSIDTDAGTLGDWLGVVAYGAAARLRLMVLQGMVGVYGGPWRRRAASRDRLD